MSAELIGILSVGAVLAALTLTLFKDLRDRFDGIETRLRAVEHGMAKLEGLLKGLLARRSRHVRGAETKRGD